MTKLWNITILMLMLLPGCAAQAPNLSSNPQIHIKASKAVQDIVSPQNIARVQSETEKALDLIPPILGITHKEQVKINVVKGGICNARGGIISLPIRFVSTNSAATVHEVTHLIAKHHENRFFSEGLAVYFQERFGEDKCFPCFGIPLNALLREYKTELMPLTKLHRSNDIFRQIGTEERRVAYMEAGSFISFLVEVYGEEKLAELHNSWTLNYGNIYGKPLEELEAEWLAAVF